jgi:hypothetical protein
VDTRIRLIIAAVIAVLVLIVGYFQISSYFAARREIETQRHSLQKIIAENTEGVRDLLQLDVDTDGTTFAELFERSNDRLKQLSEAMISIGVSPLPKEERSALKSYISGMQTVLRYQVAAYRKQLDLSTKLDAAERASKNYANGNYLTSDFDRKQAKDALVDANDAMRALKSAQKEHFSKLVAFRANLNLDRKKLSDYNLLDDEFIKSVIAADKPTN